MNLVVAILAFLQVIPWPIAGFLIIATALLVVLSYLSSRRGESVISVPPIPSPETSLRRAAPSRDPVLSEKKISKHPTEVTESAPKHPITKASKEIERVEESSEPKLGDPTRVSEGDYLSFDVDLENGEEVMGEVTSSGDVNVYILNDENLTALDSDQEFWYEAGSEGVRNATLRFTAPEDGKWFLIVENADSKEVTATAKIDVRRPSHQVPFLKAESLELPDARLDGKL